MSQIPSSASMYLLNSSPSHLLLKNEVTYISYYLGYPIKLSTKCTCKTRLTCFYKVSPKEELNC